jgi:hypothetical protein
MASPQSLRCVIERLAAIDRASCSPGEHEAAEWIAARLREYGAEARVERHHVHGTYWWPLSITSALGLAGAIIGGRGKRLLGAGLGGLGAALVADELGAGRRWLRAGLPKQVTANVVAHTGDLDAARTVVIVAHHDAAHTGVFHNPRIAELVGRYFGGSSDEPPRPLALMVPIAVGPALAGVGALSGSRGVRWLGGLTCAGIIGSFVDIAARSTVPGANDNLTGVATLLRLAEVFATRPVRGVRVLLLSTGAEEALMEGMRAFARAHFPELGRRQTHVLCVDSVGSPYLVLAEAEGMLKVRQYDPAFKDLIAECAATAGVRLRRGMSVRLGTDGFIALRHGIPAAMLMSVNQQGTASNYHWPSDTPDRVDYSTLGDAVRLCELVVRKLGSLAGGASTRQADVEPPAPRRSAAAP